MEMIYHAFHQSTLYNLEMICHAFHQSTLRDIEVRLRLVGLYLHGLEGTIWR